MRTGGRARARRCRGVSSWPRCARRSGIRRGCGSSTRCGASAPEALCQCELLPLFDMSQPALAKHLKVLVGAGVIGTERRGLWAYYFLLPDAPQGASDMAELTDTAIREPSASATPPPRSAAPQAVLAAAPRRRRLRPRRAAARCSAATLYDAGETDAVPEAAVDASLGLRRADRRRRPARGRDGARPRLRRRRRRAHQRPPRRPDRPRDRARHDRRDARPGARATPPRRAWRTPSSSRATSRPIPLPDASVDVVISNCVINLAADKRVVLARGRARPAPRRPPRRLRRDRRPRHGRCHARRHAAVDRLHRRRADRGRVPHRADRRRPGRRRDPPDAPRPRARRLGDRARRQARR